MERFVRNAPVILSYGHKPLGEGSAGPVQQRVIDIQAEKRRVSRIIENVRLCRRLALHVEGDGVTGSKREFLLQPGLENRGLSSNVVSSSHAYGIQGIHDAIPTHVDRQSRVKYSARSAEHLPG